MCHITGMINQTLCEFSNNKTNTLRYWFDSACPDCYNLDRFKSSVPVSIPDDPERKYLDLLDK